MRIYELAKQLGIDSKELLSRLKELNFPVKSHMSAVDEETAEIIKHEIIDLQHKEIEKNVIEVDFPITVKDLAVKLNEKPSELLKKLIQQGKFLTINSALDEDEARKLAYEYKVNLRQKAKYEEKVFQVGEEDLRPRPPVVTLMGHIDHGKTSILDYIRNSQIASRETGGITQHIGAYQVKLDKGIITFLDTPGHETFTAMRARGANVTDIAVIVIAADEGIKPQTIEAIDHARVAEVPIIVAVNKIDRPNADLDMVKQQLSQHNLVPEDWGGNTVVVPVSAKTGEGIKDLLDLILIQAELMELKASYNRPAIGIVIEAKLSKGKGPVVSLLVQHGTLKVGDICVVGQYWGKIRAMYNDWGENLSQAGPSCPAEVIGLNGVPDPGEKFFVANDEKTAKQIIERRKEEIKNNALKPVVHLKLEDLHQKIKEGNLKQLKIILKCDVGGTLEAVSESLEKLSNSEVEVKLIHKGVGAINSSDILLAEVSDAVVIGFKVSIDSQAREMARKKGIEVRIYQIVYELIDEVKNALEGLLSPQIRKVFLGRARVQKVFKLSKAGTVAGCIVEKGKILRSTICEIIRDQELVAKSKIVSLKRFKDDVREVGENTECGIVTEYKDIQEGDYIDCYQEEKIERKL